MIKRLFCFSLIILCCLSAYAQKHQQIWLDYQVDLPFANRYLFEVTSSYQTLLTDSAKWRNLSISPIFEFNFIRDLDFISGIPLLYTNQTATYNSFEFDPYIGAQYFISQNRRIDSKFIFKLEERFFQNLETHNWENSSRVRLKAEARTAINRKNIFQDKLWYSVLDYEAFIVVDQQVHERFANRFRARFGLGYRLSYKHRFEVLYTLQASRNEIYGDLIRNDNVLQLRYKMFLNPTPTSKPTDHELN